MPTTREGDSTARSRAAALVQHVAETALGEDANFLLARANALAITEGNSALAEHGLRVRSYSVLVLAAAEAGPSQRELAEILRLDPSQVVALVDELEGRGLVDRRPAPGDRRANVVVATEEGRDLLARATVSAGLAEHRVLEELDASERIQLVALLRRIAFRTV